MKPLKIIFFSSSNFCIPILESIITNPAYQLVGVVTQPDWTNRNKIYKNPISKFLENKSIQLFQPIKINNSIEEFKTLFPDIDLGIVASYGQIISDSIVNHPSQGMINWHPSLLPKLRGPTPLQTSILNGDKNGGLTWLKMDKGMDSGDIINQYMVEYADLKFSDLILKMGILGGKTLEEVIDLYINNKNLIKQDNSTATFTKMIKKEDSLLINHKTISSLSIMNHFRAFDAFPKTKVLTSKFGEIKLLDIVIWTNPKLTIDDEDEDFFYSNGKIILKTLDGCIIVRELQLETGRIIKSSK